jgi:hypothetical protein
MELYLHTPYASSLLKQRDRFTLTSTQQYFRWNFVDLGNYGHLVFHPSSDTEVEIPITVQDGQFPKKQKHVK